MLNVKICNKALSLTNNLICSPNNKLFQKFINSEAKEEIKFYLKLCGDNVPSIL